MNVAADAAHHVVDHRADRNQLFDGINVLVLQAQLTDEWQLRVDQLLAEVPHIQVDDISVRSFNRGLFPFPGQKPGTDDRAGPVPSSAAPVWVGASRGCNPAGSDSRPC